MSGIHHLATPKSTENTALAQNSCAGRYNEEFARFRRPDPAAHKIDLKRPGYKHNKQRIVGGLPQEEMSETSEQSHKDNLAADDCMAL
jgi:hypothetical protein